MHQGARVAYKILGARIVIKIPKKSRFKALSYTTSLSPYLCE
jgi:hypothetical protein